MTLPGRAVIGPLVKKPQVFGWHALMMTLAFPVLGTEALLSLSWRPGNAGAPSPLAVRLHLLLHVLSLVCIVLGLVAIVLYKRLPQEATPTTSSTDMGYSSRTYSVHSWVGIATLGLWGLQLLGGMAKRLLRPSPANAEAVHRAHAFLGKAAFAGGVA